MVWEHPLIERIHSRDQQPCKFTGTKERFYIRKEFNSHRTGLVHQHGRRFIVLVHQYGYRDFMCIRRIQGAFPTETIVKNLLWVNGVGTVVAKRKENIVNKGTEDIQRMTHSSQVKV